MVQLPSLESWMKSGHSQAVRLPPHVLMILLLIQLPNHRHQLADRQADRSAISDVIYSFTRGALLCRHAPPPAPAHSSASTSQPARQQECCFAQPGRVVLASGQRSADSCLVRAGVGPVQVRSLGTGGRPIGDECGMTGAQLA